MKHLSFKTKVSILYSTLLVVFITAVLGMTLLIARSTITANTRDVLTSAVDMAVDDISVSSGKIVISPEMNYRVNGASVSVYNADGLCISGLEPENVGEGVEFIDDEIREIDSGVHVYIFDRLIENSKSGDIWVRGVISADMKDMSPDFMKIMRAALIMIPLLLIIAVTGGLLITDSAFKPLKQITDTAEDISKSGDLTQRIGIGEPDSNDEIIRAAGVFDNMLDKVEESFENEKRFTNDASHELRTPISVIMAQSEYALDVIDNKEEVKSSLESIHSKAVQMRSLVSQLLMLARADHGTQKLNKEKTDISLLAEESRMTHLKLAEEKKITIRVDAEEGIYLNADPAFFVRIYDNLFTNAIKYGRENGSVTCEIRENDNIVTIRIIDDGQGISERDLPHIFERFYRVRQSNDGSSAGLGLPIVKWIVEQHGGTIRCESVENIGTRFTIIFPSF